MTSGGNKSPNAANGLWVNISRLLLRSGSILDGTTRRGERRALCGHRQLEYLVAHRIEVAQHPGRRRGKAGDGSGIDEPGAAAVSAMDDGLRTFGCRVVYGALQRVGAIVAVRDDADLHVADRLIAAFIASRAVDL